MWILHKDNGQRVIRIVNPSSKSELIKVKEFLPCTVEMRLNEPFTFNNRTVSIRQDLYLFYIYFQCGLSVYVFVENFQNLRMHVFNNPCVRFYNGNVQIGYKTKYRFDYQKLLEILLLKDINVMQAGFTHIGLGKDEKVDTLWNRLC